MQLKGSSVLTNCFRVLNLPFRHRKIAIIVDDIGYNPLPMEELIKIDAPLTFAILPYCPYSISSAEDLHKAKREILLHLPMKPLSYPRINPGKGALLLRMDREKLRGSSMVI